MWPLPSCCGREGNGIAYLYCRLVATFLRVVYHLNSIGGIPCSIGIAQFWIDGRADDEDSGGRLVASDNIVTCWVELSGVDTCVVTIPVELHGVRAVSGHSHVMCAVTVLSSAIGHSTKQIGKISVLNERDHTEEVLIVSVCCIRSSAVKIGISSIS